MSTYGEQSWGDKSGGYSKDRKSTKDMWLKLNKGPNIVRLLTNPFQYLTHKGVKKVGEPGFGRKVGCSEPNEKGSCPLCKKGLKASPRWLVGVLDRKTTSYKVIDIPWQVMSQIRKLNDQEIWGDPTKYDINIIVDDSMPQSYYTVSPHPHKPLSPTEQKFQDEADLEYLKSRTEPLTAETVEKILAKMLGEDGKLFIPTAPGKPGQVEMNDSTPDGESMDEFPDFNAS